MPLSGSAQQCYIALQAYLGYPDYSHITAIDYSSAASNPTLTAIAPVSTVVSVNASTTDTPIALGTLFPALTGVVFIALMDVTGTPQPFSYATAAGTRFSVAPGGWVAWMPNGGAPPTIYLTNPSSTTASNIQISILSN